MIQVLSGILIDVKRKAYGWHPKKVETIAFAFMQRLSQTCLFLVLSLAKVLKEVIIHVLIHRVRDVRCWTGRTD